MNNAVQITLFGTTNGTTLMVNVLAALKTGTVSVDQALTNLIGASIKSAWTSNMAPRCNSSTALNNVGLRDLSSANFPMFLDTGATIVGTGTGDSLPGGTACVVSLKTALAGKRYRGRVYIGGFTETENTVGGGISALAQTAAAGFVTAIDTTLKTHAMALAVLSRPAFAQTFTHTTTDASGNTNVVTHNRGSRPGAITQVQSIAVRNAIWDEQRRRNGPGGGSTLFAAPLITTVLS